MTYLKADNGDLFCYDSNSLLTLKFHNGSWEMSELSYGALLGEGNVKPVSEKEAKKITEGKSPENIIEQYQNVLG